MAQMKLSAAIPVRLKYSAQTAAAYSSARAARTTIRVVRAFRSGQQPAVREKTGQPVPAKAEKAKSPAPAKVEKAPQPAPAKTDKAKSPAPAK